MSTPSKRSLEEFIRIVFMGVVFGLVSDIIGTSLGAWKYAYPYILPITWAVLWIILYLLLPYKVNKLIGYFAVGFYGLLIEIMFVATGLLTYIIKPSYIIIIGENWVPITIFGWGFAALIIFTISIELYNYLAKFGRWKAFCVNFILVAFVSASLTLSYLST
ncbi:MAG: hypothetical protein ACUVWK_03220 [Nitrososphaerales archaeon]